MLTISLTITVSGYSQIGFNGKPVSLRINESNATVSERDSILNYFIQTTNQYYSYSFDKSYTLVLRDSIFPNIQNRIDSLLMNYKKEIQLNVDTLTALILRIYTRIFHNQMLPLSQRNQKDLREISDTISSLPPSKEKVLLTLNYQFLLLKPSIYLNDIFLLYSKIINEVNLISNIFEKGKACMYIGDFLFEHEIPIYTLDSYLNAQMYFYFSDKDSLQKYKLQGEVCEKMAELFPNAYTEITTGIKKQSNYFITAKEFFLRAKDTSSADRAFSKYLLNYAYLSLPSKEFDDNPSERELVEANVLHYLNAKYHSLTKPQNNNFNTFRWLNMIGVILKAESKNEEAKNIFLYALVHCIQYNDLDNINECLYNVSQMYALLQNKTLAFSYAELPIIIGEKTNNTIVFSKGLLNKANIFYILKQYDSALIYISKSIIPYNNIPLVYQNSIIDVLERAIKLRIKILEDTKSDSVWKYRVTYNVIRDKQIENYIRLLLTENDRIADWLNNVKTWEVSTEKYQKDVEKILNYKISNRNIWLGIGVGILLILASGLAYFYRKSVKQSRSIIAFKNIVTHDIKTLVNSIPDFLNNITEKENLNPLTATNLTQISDITEYVKDVFKTNEKKLSGVKEQIEFAKEYAQIFRRAKLPENYVINIINEITNPYILKELPVPSFLLNNFIKNSLEHGTADVKKSEIGINIRSLETNKGYKIIIVDNGCGLNFAKKNGGTSGKGMKFVKDTIDVYNSNKNGFKIIFSKRSIFDNEDKNLGKGTTVILEFVKKKKWKFV